MYYAVHYNDHLVCVSEDTLARMYLKYADLRVLSRFDSERQCHSYLSEVRLTESWLQQPPSAAQPVYTVQSGSQAISSAGYGPIVTTFRIPFSVRIGGGWGRIGGSTDFAVPLTVLSYARAARMFIASGVDVPWPGGYASVVLNGFEVARVSREEDLLDRPIDVTGRLQHTNTLHIEIGSVAPVHWLGETTVYGYVEVDSAYTTVEEYRAAASDIIAVHRQQAERAAEAGGIWGWIASGGLLDIIKMIGVVVIGAAAMYLVIEVVKAFKRRKEED